MPDTNRIGVVTVTYNSADVLPEFLRCMLAQTHDDFLLFVVDNASTDDTLAIVGTLDDPRVRLIANADNRGVAAGNNQGIAAALEAGCSSVLLLNNDTSFPPDLLASLDQALHRYGVEMVCPKIVYFDEPKRIWAAGGGFQPWLGYTNVHFGEGKPDHGQYDHPRRVTYSPTCCVLIRDQVFRTVGLMDERYFVYSDDTDFMFRAMRAGIAMQYIPTPTLLHKVGYLTGGETSPFSIRYGTRNRVFFLIKHFGRLRATPWFLFLRLVWWLKFKSGRKDTTWYQRKLEAYREGLRMGTTAN